VCVDCFFFSVELPEVMDEFASLGLGFGRRGIELGVGDGGGDDSFAGALSIVEGEAFDPVVQLGGFGGWCGDYGGTSCGAGWGYADEMA